MLLFFILQFYFHFRVLCSSVLLCTTMYPLFLSIIRQDLLQREKQTEKADILFFFVFTRHLNSIDHLVVQVVQVALHYSSVLCSSTQKQYTNRTLCGEIHKKIWPFILKLTNMSQNVPGVTSYLYFLLCMPMHYYISILRKNIKTTKTDNITPTSNGLMLCFRPIIHNFSRNHFIELSQT